MRNAAEGDDAATSVVSTECLPCKTKRMVRMVPGTRRLNSRATMERYLDRMRKYPVEWFSDLDNAYLSTYAISGGTIPAGEHTSTQIQRRCSAWHLMQFARSIGINVLGVTSERKEGGKYVSDTRRNASAKVVYVDRHAYFGSNRASKYCEQHCDHVYYNDDDPISVEALCAPL